MSSINLNRHDTSDTSFRPVVSWQAIISQPEMTENTVAGDTGLSDTGAGEWFEPLSLNDPYLDRQWGLYQILSPELWPVAPACSEIIVAVLDTGIDRTHEDLEGRVVAVTDLTRSQTSGDGHGHGTHVAGIIGANANNGLGIAGVAPVSRLLDVKVANDKGQCQASAVSGGIVWAVDHGASVINLSVALQEPSAELEAAVNYAWDRGVVIVAAAGNEGTQEPVYPACYDNCIAVAATDPDGKLMIMSNYGNWVNVAAPGLNIYSTLPDNSYGYKSGTSFATASVSGLAALLFGQTTDSNGNGRVNDEVRQLIETKYPPVSRP